VSTLEEVIQAITKNDLQKELARCTKEVAILRSTESQLQLELSHSEMKLANYKREAKEKSSQVVLLSKKLLKLEHSSQRLTSPHKRREITEANARSISNTDHSRSLFDELVEETIDEVRLRKALMDYEKEVVLLQQKILDSEKVIHDLRESFEARSQEEQLRFMTIIMSF
jgi:hypothetical protein